MPYLNISTRLLHFCCTLFLWDECKPGFKSSATLFNSLINVLTKAREFGTAWCMVLDQIGGEGKSDFVSKDTFAILIRRYTGAGMRQPAIRTFEFASTLDLFDNSDARMSFEILLDSFCKEGHVRVTSEYFYKKKELDPSWALPVRVYNILLNGWFRSRKLKHDERLWF